MSVAIGIWNIVYNFQGTPLRPWVNWDYVHADYDIIFRYPAVLVPPNDMNNLWGENYLMTSCGLVFFCLLRSAESPCARTLTPVDGFGAWRAGHDGAEEHLVHGRPRFRLREMIT